MTNLILVVVILFVTFIIFFLSTWINGFIVLLRYITWVRDRKISLSDFIILNLALSRIILHGIPMMVFAVTIFYPHFHHLDIFLYIVDIFWMFTNNLNISLTSCLNVFYCLKIASFSHKAFLWLKRKISHVVVWILLGSLLYSCFSTLALVLKFHVYSDMSQMIRSRNDTEEIRRIKTHYYLLHFLGTLWSFIPFSLSLLSSVLLILSLVRHTKQMKHHSTGTKDLSTMAHVRATKVILFSFILFIGYLLTFFLAMYSFFFPHFLLVMILSLIFTVFSSVQTFTLILENQKLKQEFLWMFQVIKRRPKC
ncbi:taste receptor type 2 member 3-like [Gracilinanus agilis]|uniref:taste receptor type 2 member 3-like n=1 Tax=Gracilinanus agilis TaxID=191870 RepID=UPI001CFD6649|nr:taste receptor type 2 member 3-like [Gracilinanus agilis]